MTKHARLSCDHPVVVIEVGPAGGAYEVDHRAAQGPDHARPIRRRTPLDRGWRLRLETAHPDAPHAIRDDSIAATVPGSVHLDLQAAGLIPDPYLGANELVSRWVGSCDWTYALEFAWPPADTAHGEDVAGPDHGRRPDTLDLVFDGLDTLSTVWLDGRRLGDTASTHRTWRFEVTDALTPGGHLLEVRFVAPVPAAERLTRELGVYPHANAYPEPFNMLRTMACGFGWDWGPQLPGAGIWRPAWIESSSVARLAAVRPSVAFDRPVGRVDLTVEVARMGDVTRSLRVVARIGDIAHEASVGPGEDRVQATFELPDAEPWWPHSHGSQPRSRLHVELWHESTLLDTWERAIGFRTVTLDTRPDAVGTRFQLVVNGVRLWVRGANWIPDDCFPARVGRERYRERIEQAKAANVDLLRVWGGGMFESDEFYDICDELGMMVWQDFPFACAAYPETAEMTAQVEGEARDNITRLMSHPSLVIWNGNNECVWLGELSGWAQQVDGRPWGRGWWEDLLPRLTGQLDPGRPYWPGSPTSPAGSGAAPNDPDHGTMHIWDVWNQLDYEMYREHRPRFAAEFGFQGPPSWSTLSRSLGTRGLDVDSSVLAHHQKAGEGMAKLRRGLEAHFGAPADFDDWLYLSQLNQARAISLGVEHLRSVRDVCSGAIVWQLNDCWPAISWSAIDGDGHRKPMWYALRRSYADRLLTIQPAEFRLRAVLVNETDATWTTEVRARRLRLDGEPLAEVRFEVTIEDWGIASVDLPGSVGVPRHAAGEILVIDAGALRAVWTWLPDRDLAYPDARWSVARTTTPGGHRVTLTAASLLRDVCLFPDRLHPDAVVDEMLVTLLPGEAVTFEVTGALLPDLDALLRAPVLRCVNDTSRP